MTKTVGILFLVLFSQVLCADLNRDLNDFFNKFGAAANVNQADIYDGQKAGYMTGGGLAVRNRVMSSKPITVNLPSFDAGCGGIDIYAGGFSFINREQLVNNLKSIGSSAIGYSFLLGLETVSPQVANTIKQLQTWSNTINDININSCETAASLVGSVWPKRSLGSQQICRTLGSSRGLFSDYVSARHGCSNTKEYDAVQALLDEEGGNGESLGFSRNVAWEALQKQTVFASNQELTELVMTLTGTVLVDKKGRGTVVASGVNDREFLDVLLRGGALDVQTCLDDRCLNLGFRPIHLKPANAWLGKVRSLLMRIQEKVLSDQELDSEERALLTKTSLPIYKIVNVLTAYRKGRSPIDLYQVAEMVAMDLLAQYLEEVITLVRDGARQARLAQNYSDDFDGFIANLNELEQTVRHYETRSHQKMEEEFYLMQKLQLIEQQFARELVL